MRNLMKFGIVLVVLAMVSVAFASNDYEGDDGGSWCDPDNWDNGDVPQYDDGEDARIRDGGCVIIDENCTDGAEALEIRDGCVQIGTATSGTIIFDVDKDLAMADDSSGDLAILKIVDGIVTVEDQSKDVGEDGDIVIFIAAGSSLTFEDGMYFGDSNGDNSVYDLIIAGDFTCDGDRIEQRGGALTVDLTGDGTFSWEKTARYSSDNDSVATFNLSDNAAVNMDGDIELGEKDDKADFDWSLAINMSDNSTWGTDGEEIKFKDKGQILNITVTDDAEFEVKDINDGDEDDGEVNITVSGNGSVEITDDCDVGQGTISVTGAGALSVDDSFNLGIDDGAYMLVATTGEVSLGDLSMGKDDEEAELTIDDCRVDVDSLEMGDDSSIDILGNGELVIKDADDQEDWDDIAELIDDGDIMTSEAGMVVIWDYDVTNDGALTVRIAIPVGVDFQPGSCENPLRVNFISGGVYPVAITGSEDFDVLDVDVDTITLEGVAVLRGAIEDVSNADDVCDLGPDGIPDLITKFSRAALLEALEEAHGDLGELPNRAELRLNLLGRTVEGTLISGSDSLLILNQGTIKRSRR